MQTVRRLILLTVLLAGNPAAAAEAHWRDGGKVPGPHVENEQLFMFVRLLTPEQMAAFYEARGFPREAIERIRQTCFVMAHIENRGDRILWLDLDNWRFTDAGGEIHPLDEAYWEGVWDEIDMPQASRSTFGWTQLPGLRDLRPGEPVGGNVVLPRRSTPFTLEADFQTGANRRQGLVHVSFRDLQCAADPPAP